MKIIKQPVYHHFGEIKPGTVFSVDEIIYMAIEPIVETGTGAVMFNAVNLETGELAYYFDADLIQFVEAELCVK